MFSTPLKWVALVALTVPVAFALPAPPQQWGSDHGHPVSSSVVTSAHATPSEWHSEHGPSSPFASVDRPTPSEWESEHGPSAVSSVEHTGHSQFSSHATAQPTVVILEPDVPVLINGRGNVVRRSMNAHAHQFINVTTNVPRFINVTMEGPHNGVDIHAKEVAKNIPTYNNRTLLGGGPKSTATKDVPMMKMMTSRPAPAAGHKMTDVPMMDGVDIHAKEVAKNIPMYKNRTLVGGHGDINSHYARDAAKNVPMYKNKTLVGGQVDISIDARDTAKNVPMNKNKTLVGGQVDITIDARDAAKNIPTYKNKTLVGLQGGPGIQEGDAGIHVREEAKNIPTYNNRTLLGGGPKSTSTKALMMKMMTTRPTGPRMTEGPMVNMTTHSAPKHTTADNSMSAPAPTHKEHSGNVKMAATVEGRGRPGKNNGNANANNGNSNSGATSGDHSTVGEAIVVNACPFSVNSNIVHAPRPGVAGTPEEIFSVLAPGAVASHDFSHDPHMGISWKVWRTDVANTSPVQFEYTYMPDQGRIWYDVSMIDAGKVAWTDPSANPAEPIVGDADGYGDYLGEVAVKHAFADVGMTLSPLVNGAPATEGGSCVAVKCEPGAEFCKDAYNVWNDWGQQHDCAQHASLKLTLCG